MAAFNADYDMTRLSCPKLNVPKQQALPGQVLPPDDYKSRIVVGN